MVKLGDGAVFFTTPTVDSKRDHESGNYKLGRLKSNFFCYRHKNRTLVHITQIGKLDVFDKYCDHGGLTDGSEPYFSEIEYSDRESYE